MNSSAVPGAESRVQAPLSARPNRDRNSATGTTQRDRTTARKQAILDAALKLFVERGFRATSIDDICAASGASNGSLYHHFGCKEGVAAKLYASAIEDYQRSALDVFRGAGSAEAGFRGCVEQFLTWVHDHRDLAYLMLAVDHSDIRGLAANRVAVLNEQFQEEVGEWMRARSGAGELPDVPPDLMLPALLGPARRFAELWLEGKTKTPIRAASAVLTDVAWNGLGGVTPAAARSGGTGRRGKS